MASKSKEVTQRRKDKRKKEKIQALASKYGLSPEHERLMHLLCMINQK
jgi:hypothetical protein